MLLRIDDLTVGSVGNWICESNSDCSFLRSGEERGWYVNHLPTRGIDPPLSTDKP